MTPSPEEREAAARIVVLRYFPDATFDVEAMAKAWANPRFNCANEVTLQCDLTRTQKQLAEAREQFRCVENRFVEVAPIHMGTDLYEAVKALWVILEATR